MGQGPVSDCGEGRGDYKMVGGGGGEGGLQNGRGWGRGGGTTKW